MKVLVISSCTSKKLNHNAPAAKMYTGQQHTLLMEGVNQVRACHGQSSLDVAIISAEYGLLNENDVIAPYNVTFQGMKKAEILEKSRRLQLRERVAALIARYDVVFFLLGKEYVQALQLPLEESRPGGLSYRESESRPGGNASRPGGLSYRGSASGQGGNASRPGGLSYRGGVPESVTQIFLLGAGYRRLIPDAPNVHFVPAGSALSRTLGVMGVALKGFVFKKICEAVCREGFNLFAELRQKPQMIRDIALAGK